jgi:Tol biopolymer transport system component
MYTSAIRNKNNNLSNYSTAFMGFLLLLISSVGLVGCNSSSSSTPPPPEAFITRISVDAAGAGGDSSSVRPLTTPDGRYVVFESLASNLVSGDTNNSFDIFVRDTQENTIKRVSIDSNGVEGNDDSLQAGISADGRYVVFRSAATNLVSADNNAAFDIFLHDLTNSTTTRISVATGANGAESDGSSAGPSISTDGRYVVFISIATNLIGAGNDTNGTFDIYVRDITNSTTTRVSVSTNGVESNGTSTAASISSDGLTVSFSSSATNLIDTVSDNNSVDDIFVRDITNNITTRVSVADGVGAVESNGASVFSSISADGNYVAFASSGNNLIANDLNNQRDIFVRNIAGNATTRVNISSSGAESDDSSDNSSISADGRFIAFITGATNLISNDTNGFRDVFVHDVQLGKTVRVSVDSNGVEGNDNVDTNGLTISADGRYVVFGSNASNLVENDIEMRGDIFRVLISETP